MLSILAGSKRYAHIAGVRGDAVAAQALGLNKIVSEDSVRRALKAIEPQAAQTWMHQALQGSLAQAGPAQPRLAHLLGGQPAPGARHTNAQRQTA